MPSDFLSFLASAILAVHAGVIAFNVAGLILIPLGAWRGWRFVRSYWLRAFHLGLLLIVMIQAVLGRACILTIWQVALEQGDVAATPLIKRWVEDVIYWDLPLWVFAAIYVIVFIYAAALWRWVPPRRPQL